MLKAFHALPLLAVSIPLVAVCTSSFIKTQHPKMTGSISIPDENRYRVTRQNARLTDSMAHFFKRPILEHAIRSMPAGKRSANVS
jgi:hypothetical protein